MKTQLHPEHIASTLRLCPSTARLSSPKSSSGGASGQAGSLLQVRLFGGLTLTWDNATLPLAGRSAPSLFAYLITYRHRAHTRNLLAGTFWPDLPDAQARRRLSQALWRIRRMLSPLPSPIPFILSDADTIQFNVEADYWLDTEEFQVACSRFPVDIIDLGLETLNMELETLRNAVQLYSGDFMAGFYDNWTVIERERLREMYLAALGRLLELCKARGVYEEALRYAQRLAAEDPLREEGHREVMRLCHLLGRNNEALQQYELCRAVLAEELGAEPTATTTALCREIAASVGEAEIPYLPLAPGLLPSPLLEGTGQVPLVGRQQERTTLAGYLEQAISGQGGMVLVEGEAGVGKTRLLQEVARDAEWRGVQVLWGRGRELAELPPYGVLSEALRAGLLPLRAGQLVQLVEGVWLREVSLILPELAEWLPDLLPHVALGPEQDRMRLLEALTRTVLALGQIAPQVLILEDLQWADEATLEALAHLTRRLAESRVLVIGSCRGEEVRERAAVWEALQALDRAGYRERLELSRLTGEETGELVRRGLGLTEEAPLFEARLYQETAGNPLFALETLRALHDEGLLYRDPSGEWSTPWDKTTTDYAELPLPPEVYQVIARRLARLGADERATLNTAAVLGADFDFTLLFRAGNLEQEASLAAVSELVRRRLLEEEPTAYRFSHDKVRQVAYTEMAEAERRRRHRQAGEALETLHPEQAESLAYHFTEARVWDKALDYNRQAGDRARAVYANQAALTYYEQALSLVDKDDLVTQWEIHRQRERVLNVLGRREEQLASLAEMMRLAVALSDESRRAATLYRQGHLKVRTGAPTEGLALLQEAADIARKLGDPSLAGKCCNTIGRAHWLLGDAPRCLAAAEEARTLFRQANDRGGEVGALNLMGNLYLGLLGHYEQALHCFQQMLAIAREINDVERENAARANAGIALMAMGCYQRSQDYLSRAEAFFTQVGYKLWLAVIAFGQGNNHLGLGNYDAARSAAERCLALCREVGNRNFEIEALWLLGQIVLDQGRLHQAQAYFEEAVEVAQASEQLHDLAWQQSYLALTHLRLGEGETARQLSAEAVSIMESQEQHIGLLEIVFFNHYRILAQLEGGEAAQPYLARAYEVLRTRADTIHDPELRHSFLENVAENRAIVAAHRFGYLPARLRRQTVHLPAASAPTGRPLRDDEWVEATWTVTAPEDDAVLGKVARRQQRLQRLLREAKEQGAAPTVDDLGDALGVSRATIKRDLAALRRAGHEVRTRGSRNH